jgi:hypothetical protein
MDTNTVNSSHKAILSEYEALQQAVKANLNSSVAWNQLVEYAVNSRDTTKVRETYDWLLQVYPNTVRIVSVLLCFSITQRLVRELACFLQQVSFL